MGRLRLLASTYCPQYGLTINSSEFLEKPVVRCPNGGMRHLLHADLIGILLFIPKDVGVPDMAVVTEARGLRSADATSHGDVVVLDFFVEGRHLVIDVVVTTVYRNTILRHATSIPGYAAKQAEDRKFLADQASTQPIAAIHGGPHILVPFPIEDGGRLGAHALALLRALATLAMDKGRRPPFAYMATGLSAPALTFLWV